MKLPPRLQHAVNLLRDGPRTSLELLEQGVSQPPDTISRLRAHGFRIVTILGDDGRAIYSLLEGEQ